MADDSAARDREEEALQRFAHGRGNGDDTTGWPACLDLERLAETEPEQPRFIINDWMPTGYATLFAGHYGVTVPAL